MIITLIYIFHMIFKPRTMAQAIQKIDINIDYYISNKIKVQDFYFQDILAYWAKFKKTLKYLMLYNIALFVPSLILAVCFIALDKGTGTLFIIGIVFLPVMGFSFFSILYALFYIRNANSFINSFQNWQMANSKFDDENLIENMLQSDALEKYHQVLVCSARHKFVIASEKTMTKIQNKKQPIKLSIFNKAWFKSPRPAKIKDKKIHVYSLMVIANAQNLYIDGYKANINMFAYDYLKFVLNKDVKLSLKQINNDLEV
ncbi:MAG0920 family protein [Mycoplasma sp. CR]|uniref:MAG0920 family protein n=1 Tax=Mycoplasma sp. CR TaxID=3401693 RepID=UPI003AAEB1B0